MGYDFANIGAGAPYFYDYKNSIASQCTPGTVHVSSSTLQWYFRRYLLQKAINVFQWKLPPEWAKNYFLYVLYCWGYIAVVETDKFGVIPQACSLAGYDVFYQPNKAVISNPKLKGILEPTIYNSDKNTAQCTIIKLMPDYGGLMDKINFYADMMALCAETAGTNLLNSKLAYVFAASNKTQAESFKKLYDNVASGQPASVIDKNLFNEDGSPNWIMFNQDLKGTYIAGDILEDMRKWEEKFCTDLGIPNANTDKRERLITSEVEANDIEVKTWAEGALESLQEGCKKTRELFGINIRVGWRFNKGGMSNGTARDDEPFRIVSGRSDAV